MKAVILAAGYGTRLLNTSIDTPEEDYIRRTPKPLLEIAGRPLINHLLDKLTGVNVDEVRIVSNNYYMKQFNEWFNQNHRSYDFGINIFYNGSDSYGRNKGAVVDMCLALGLRPNKVASVYFKMDNVSKLDEFNDDCIVLFGDRWLPNDLNLEDFVELMEENDTCVIGVYDTGDLKIMEGKSQLRFDSQGKVVMFEEKSLNPTETFTCPGPYILKKEDYALIKNFLEEEAAKGKRPDAPGYFIQDLFGREEPLYAIEIKSEPFDFGTRYTWLEAKRIIESSNTTS